MQFIAHVFYFQKIQLLGKGVSYSFVKILTASIPLRTIFSSHLE